MSKRQELKEALMFAAECPNGHPDDNELDLVIADIIELRKTKAPTKADWISSASRRVFGAGTFRRLGQDLSDLNSLLDQVLAAQRVQDGRK